ncbi:TonB-dependent receptor [Leptospira interrogans serovar Canicola]|nr:TonB-dependent receptor [Leptospira interrogans serovar Canicola]
MIGGITKRRNILFFYNTPLIKNKLYISISGKSTQRNGYLNNVSGFNYPNNLVSDIPIEVHKTHPDGRRGKSGRLRLFWTPLENLEVDLQTNAESFDDGSLNIVNYLASKTERRKSLVKGCVVSPEVCDKNIRTYINRTKAVRKVFWDYEGVSNTTGKTYSSNITYKLPKAIFKTVYSIRKMEIDPLIVDGDFTRSPVIKSEYIEHSTTRTHETSIESKNKKRTITI